MIKKYESPLPQLLEQWSCKCSVRSSDDSTFALDSKSQCAPLCFQLEGFDRYKYNCRDTSPLSNYVMHPFWNKAVLLCPSWVAPNLLTLVGFICCVLHYLIPAIYDYDFTASVKDSDHPIPNWVWLLVGILLFASHTLDGIDGKQARRTGTSSPLGKLLGHNIRKILSGLVINLSFRGIIWSWLWRLGCCLHHFHILQHFWS